MVNDPRKPRDSAGGNSNAALQDTTVERHMRSDCTIACPSGKERELVAGRGGSGNHPVPQVQKPGRTRDPVPIEERTPGAKF